MQRSRWSRLNVLGLGFAVALILELHWLVGSPSAALVVVFVLTFLALVISIAMDLRNKLSSRRLKTPETRR
jgi:hypothetical protein